MDSEQLRDFLAAYQYSSFRVAADKLFCHPSSVSRSVSALERELGVSLFTRRSNGITSTPAGDAFAREADRILTTMRQAHQITLQASAADSLALCVRAVQDSLMQTLPLFERFLAANPACALDYDLYEPADGLDFHRKLEKREIDLLILSEDHLPKFSSGSFHLRKVATERLVLIAGRSHPLADREAITLADLAGLTLGTGNFHDNSIARALTAELGRRGLERAHFENPVGRGQLFLRVAAGLTVTIGPRSAAHAWHCRSVPISDFALEKALYIAWHPSNDNPSLRAFVEQRDP